MNSNHYTKEDWTLYINGTVQQNQQLKMEEHLYTCDQCLQDYMESLAQVSIEPSRNESDDFIDSVMQKIEPAAKARKPLKQEDSIKVLDGNVGYENGRNKEGAQKKKSSTQKGRKKQTLLHYVIAASLTFILMSSGIFEEIAFGSNAEENDMMNTIHEKEEISVSERLLDKITITIEEWTNLERSEGDEQTK
ncbi:anti-sigma factor family protein [Alkalihalobacillus trypoxylicola]|uniref:Zinc-finger domain-containing protein n=1 Tax=Alkalihalobacillus trypoxylicola TaxID=519424 RepID=A0A161PH73_9BACI|nr:hypothetical protein [Alkalihalobacillus trypoxylicola]KYG28123.1 hypothetical protein AZF04_09475 [Alkalihalobacillus trypoxylicola]